ncbi:MAG TPA: TerB family tellurite resistance protein [Azospirillaceae bacterium]|nr:TerB family tellurite resistance protein [Azospirillaceae bacterium]
MSIWGKIVGGAAGFAVGGPIGALLGAMAGHAVDSLQTVDAPPGGEVLARQSDTERDETRHIAFTIGVIVLAAKMAKADGAVTVDEVAAFREVFHVPPEELGNVTWLFDRAKRDSAGFEPYARQIARLLRHRRPVLERLLDGLFHIARADGGIHDAEVEFLRDVARIFGFSDIEFERIRTSNGANGTPDPYALLEVDPSATDAEVRAAYRRLAREHHPDQLIAQGVPPDFVALANHRMAVINEAWAAIRHERGI